MDIQLTDDRGWTKFMFR